MSKYASISYLSPESGRARVYNMYFLIIENYNDLIQYNF